MARREAPHPVFGFLWIRILRAKLPEMQKVQAPKHEQYLSTLHVRLSLCSLADFNFIFSRTIAPARAPKKRDTYYAKFWHMFLIQLRQHPQRPKVRDIFVEVFSKFSFVS